MGKTGISQKVMVLEMLEVLEVLEVTYLVGVSSPLRKTHSAIHEWINVFKGRQPAGSAGILRAACI